MPLNEAPLIVSENINIIENTVDKKGKGKRGKNDIRGIPQEIINASNIATNMILKHDSNPVKGTPEHQISSNSPDLNVPYQIPVSSQNKNTEITTKNNDFAPSITEVMTKSPELISNDPFLDSSSDKLPSISKSSSLKVSFNLESDEFLPSEKLTSLEENSSQLTTSEISDKNVTVHTKNEINKQKSNPFEDNRTPPSPDKDLESINQVTLSSIDDLNNLNPTDLISDKIVSCITDDKFLAESEGILGATEISEFNTYGSPREIPARIISEKVKSDIPGVLYGSSEAILEEVSKIIPEKITTEIPDSDSDVSKISPEKPSTELNRLEMIHESFDKLLDEKILNTSNPNVFLKGLTKDKVSSKIQSLYLPNKGMTSKQSEEHGNLSAAAEEEELTNLEETKEISKDMFNDIMNNLSSSSREDIEQLLAGTLSQDPGIQDEKLTNLLIDMLIEQETMKLAASGDLPADIESDGSDMEETTSTNQTSTNSANTVIENKSEHGNSLKSNETDYNNGFRTMTKENSEPVFTTTLNLFEECSTADGNVSPKPYVTTPTLSRRGIGGSQRYSREERPDLIEISRRYVSSSSDEESVDDDGEGIKYVVTEPSPTINKRKVTFKFESEDVLSDEEEYDKDSRVHFELVDETKEHKNKDIATSPTPPNLVRSSSSDSTTSKRSSIEIPKIDDINKIKKVERKFERMASETLEDNSLAKGAVEGEFQRLMSQLSHEEMDECLQVWNESDLISISEEKSEVTDLNRELENEGGTVE